jgi:hypothetical protein
MCTNIRRLQFCFNYINVFSISNYVVTSLQIRSRNVKEEQARETSIEIRRWREIWCNPRIQNKRESERDQKRAETER